MTKNQSITILWTFCFLTAIAMAATTTSAQTVSAGVTNGEIFDYTYRVIWSSTNPSATPSNDLVELNNTQKVQLKITDISGQILSADFIMHFKNGTSSVQSGTINLNSGSVTVPFGFLIIGSNLGKGQLVYPNGGHQTIADTVNRSYASGQRETNVVTSQESDETLTMYFDKIKGVAVDYSYQTTGTSNGYTTTTTETMVSTNADVWAVSQASNSPTPTIPEFSFAIVPIVLVAALAALLLVKHRK